jgi:hypothetical protein
MIKRFHFTSRFARFFIYFFILVIVREQFFLIHSFLCRLMRNSILLLRFCWGKYESWSWFIFWLYSYESNGNSLNDFRLVRIMNYFIYWFCYTTIGSLIPDNWASSKKFRNVILLEFIEAARNVKRDIHKLCNTIFKKIRHPSLSPVTKIQVKVILLPPTTFTKIKPPKLQIPSSPHQRQIYKGIYL